MKKLWVVIVVMALMLLVVLGIKTVNSFLHQPETVLLQGQIGRAHV